MHFGKFTLLGGENEGVKNAFQKGKTGNKMELKDDGCLDLRVRVEMEGETPTDLSSIMHGSCLNVGLREKLMSLMTDLRTDWLMMKFMHKEALGKEHAQVVGHEFGYMHAVFYGSETIKQGDTLDNRIYQLSFCLKREFGLGMY